MDLFQQQQYAQAAELLDIYGPQFPQQAAFVLYFRSCLAARMDQPTRAVELVQQALDQDLWYSEEVIRQTPSWQGLQGQPDFEAVAAVSIERYKAAQAQATAELVVAQPAADRPLPTLIALHGNGDNAAMTIHGWEPAIDIGWRVAAIQSSQIQSPDAYVWNDDSQSLADIISTVGQLRAEHTIERLYIAGFSMGGHMALKIALEQILPVDGFVLVGPAIFELERYTLQQRAGLRGAVLLGSNDNTVNHERIKETVAWLNQHGIPTTFTEIPGLHHTYPDDPALLQQTLRSISASPKV